jgi:hypothetical protein
MINALTIAALLAAPAAAPAAPACVPRQMVSDAFVVLSPYAVRAVREGCTRHLPASAFLSRGGEALATRLQSEGAGMEESAIELFGFFSDGEIPEVKDKAALLKVTAELVQSTLAKDLTPKACVEANRIVEALAPLPGRNLGSVMASLMAFGAASSKGKGPRVCDDG